MENLTNDRPQAGSGETTLINHYLQIFICKF